jgi:hypothetical protein
MRFIFRHFTSNKLFTKKILELEKKILELEGTINKVKDENGPPHKPDNIEKENAPTITIEHLRVDKIIIEHLDYANNFGQLGIKELSGKLNIGTSYEGDISKLVDEKVAEKLGTMAKVNLRAKKEP